MHCAPICSPLCFRRHIGKHSTELTPKSQLALSTSLRGFLLYWVFGLGSKICSKLKKALPLLVFRCQYGFLNFAKCKMQELRIQVYKFFSK